MMKNLKWCSNFLLEGFASKTRIDIVMQLPIAYCHQTSLAVYLT